MPCFLSLLQSPIQAWLRPAVWIPGLNRLHSHREQWVALSGTADQLTDELIQAVDRVAEADPRTTYAVKKVDRDRHRVQIYNWTWAEWLDVVEIEFRDGANGGVEAKCFSFSSGFLPTWFPLCFIFNVILFFIPFYDNKFNSVRLERLRVAMATECRLVPKESSHEPDETTPIVVGDSGGGKAGGTTVEKLRHPSLKGSEPTTNGEKRQESGHISESNPTVAMTNPVTADTTEKGALGTEERRESAGDEIVETDLPDPVSTEPVNA